MQISKNLIRFICANMIVVLLCTIMFKQPSISKILLKQAKSNDYDTLILGQSHTETSVDPFLLSAKFDCKAFNIGRRITPVQFMYYYLKECNANNNYRRAIVDIDFTYWTSETKYVGYDTYLFPLLSGERKVEYFFDQMLNSAYGDTFFPYRISPSSLKNVNNNLSIKLMPEYYFADNDETIKKIQEKIGVWMDI